MKEKSFSKNHTLIAKGLAMILMLFDHLFWIQNGEYISLFPLLKNGNSLEWEIGSVGNICVGMFLALSGYGMYCTIEKNKNYTLVDSLKRIKKIWLTYTTITILFLSIDLIFGKIEFDFIKILLNIFLLDFSYNNYAWFMITYVVIMLVFPLCYRFYSKINWLMQIGLVIGIKVAIVLINYVLQSIIDVPEMVYKTFIEPFMFLPAFLIGYICAEYHIFEKIYEKYIEGKLEKIKLLVLFLIIFVFICKFQYTILDNITAPILSFLIAYLCYGNVIGKILAFIGRHSTNMWLMHWYLMIDLLNKIVYFPKISVLILIWLIILMLPMCYVIDYLCKKMLQRK